MKPLSKILLVIAGYGLALVAAAAVVSLYVFASSGAARQESDGMVAFGDALVFLAAFGLAAIPASVAAPTLLRPYPRFWRAASVIALGIAATGIAALVDYIVPVTPDAGPGHGAWSALSPLRLLLAPLFAIAFLLSGIVTPVRTCRRALLGATAVEITVFVWAARKLFLPVR